MKTMFEQAQEDKCTLKATNYEQQTKLFQLEEENDKYVAQIKGINDQIEIEQNTNKDLLLSLDTVQS